MACCRIRAPWAPVDMALSSWRVSQVHADTALLTQRLLGPSPPRKQLLGLHLFGLLLLPYVPLSLLLPHVPFQIYCCPRSDPSLPHARSNLWGVPGSRSGLGHRVCLTLLHYNILTPEMTWQLIKNELNSFPALRWEWPFVLCVQHSIEWARLLSGTAECYWHK